MKQFVDAEFGGEERLHVLVVGPGEVRVYGARMQGHTHHGCLPSSQLDTQVPGGHVQGGLGHAVAVPASQTCSRRKVYTYN